MPQADKVFIRKAEPADLPVLLENMRLSDKEELQATAGIDNERWLLEAALGTSIVAWTAFYDDKLCCVFGVGSASILSNEGVPWMLGTNELEKHGGVLMRTCKPYINQMHEHYPRLYNFVDVRNKTSVRWLKRLGFKFYDAVNYGVYGLPFYPFERIEHV